MRVEEVDLPGVGRKVTIRTEAGDELVIVVHQNGRRQMLYYEDGAYDEPAAALDLTDAEARELGAILGGVVFHPEQTSTASTHGADQAIEWISLPPGPWPGRTVGQIPASSDVHLLAINRDGMLWPNPGPDMQLRAGDTLVLAGASDAVDAIKAQLVL